MKKDYQDMEKYQLNTELPEANLLLLLLLLIIEVI